MEKWNNEEWQGRSRENVSFSTAVVTYSIIIIGCAAFWYGIYKLVNLF